MLTWASPHPTAIDWQHRATANGGSTHNLHRDAADRLCKSLDSTGLSGKAVEVYPFLGDNIPAVCTKLFYSKVGSTGVCRATNFTSSSILALGGLKDSANTSKFLFTDFVFATAIPGKESVLSAHWYTRDTAAAGTSQNAIGGTASVANGVIAGWVTSGARESGSIGSVNSFAAGSATSVPGMHQIANIGIRRSLYFLNGASLGALSAVSSGSFTAAPYAAQLFSNQTSSFWKRDLLFASFSVNFSSADVLSHSQEVRQFQRFLNRA